MSSSTVHSGASASLQSARTDRLGRLRRPAKKQNVCSALWLMAKTPQTNALKRRFRLPTHSTKLPISTSSPVLGTNRPAEPKSRERVLTDSELAEIWATFGDDDYGRIVKLLMLTAQRRDEVGGMRWTELDTDKNVWTIPSTRTKNHREHTVPLTDAAIALIPLRREGREHVFGDGPRRKGDSHRGFSGWSKSKAALDARILAARQKAADAGVEAEPLPDWRLHDLRRTAATVMADRLGVLPHIVEAVLNHVSGHRAGVAGVYNLARYEAEMRAALRTWADYVHGIVGHN
jgi:integrase